MKKIFLKEYLNHLNNDYEYYYTYRNRQRFSNVQKLTNKAIAEKVGVTQATLTNLNTDSKISLISAIAEVIFDNYAPLFEVKVEKERVEYPDEIIPNIQIKDIIWELYYFYGENSFY